MNLSFFEADNYHGIVRFFNCKKFDASVNLAFYRLFPESFFLHQRHNIVLNRAVPYNLLAMVMDSFFARQNDQYTETEIRNITTILTVDTELVFFNKID